MSTVITAETLMNKVESNIIINLVYRWLINEGYPVRYNSLCIVTRYDSEGNKEFCLMRGYNKLGRWVRWNDFNINEYRNENGELDKEVLQEVARKQFKLKRRPIIKEDERVITKVRIADNDDELLVITYSDNTEELTLELDHLTHSLFEKYNMLDEDLIVI